MGQSTFIEDILVGQATVDQIDDYIHTWHEGEDERDLHDALGMSWEEYGAWVANPDALNSIVEAHRQ